MKQKKFLLPLSLLFLTGCARIEQWMDRNESTTIHMELTEEQLELFDPTEYEDFNGTIEITVIEEGNEATDEPENELTPQEEEHQALIDALPEETHTDDWNIILVNNWNPLPEDFEVELEEVDNEQFIDERIVDAWNEWRDAANEAGHQLFFASGYRSVERQTANYENSIQRYLNDGYSEEEAIELTEEYIAVPNHSEHHTGLALDIVDQEWIAEGNGLIPEYDTQDSQHWLIETMTDYGFILRYPKGKEEITGINYESWHFRYVGVENAQFMEENDLVLEEFYELLEEREAQHENSENSESEETEPENSDESSEDSDDVEG